MNNMNLNMNQIMRDLPGFKAQMQQRGITDARSECMRMLQGQTMNSPQMQQIQSAMQMLGLKF